MSQELTISQADGRPMYQQIMEQIRRRIALGEWRPGQELPSIRGLAVSASVSVITVKRAYLELEREGVIVTRQGRGSFVAENAGLGEELRHSELEAHLAAAARIAASLGLAPEALASRLRQAIADQEAGT